MKRLIGSFAILLVTAGGPLFGGDAERGLAVLQDENCLTCHNVNGKGGKTAPDLARRLMVNYTPSTLASVIWNHMPVMAPAMLADQVARPRISDRDAEGVFAYLYSLHFYDNPGNAERGHGVFIQKNCSTCHSLAASGPGPGTPLPNWKPVEDPLALVQEMWNHVPAMKNAMKKQSKPWVSMNGQDLSDLSEFVRSVQNPLTQKPAGPLILPEPNSGKALFDSKCGQCHDKLVTLGKRMSNKTLLEVTAEMWNHVPRMLTLPLIDSADMRRIVAYVWQVQYMGPAGDVRQGAKVFEEKRCAVCHADPATGRVSLGRGEKVYSSFSMISLGWDHSIPLQPKMKEKQVQWPMLTPGEISNLAAFINSRP